MFSLIYFLFFTFCMLFRYYLIIFAEKKMSVRILIALGSNHEQEKNVAFAMERLHSFFPGISFSRMLWTEPIGIVSDRFVNALALADTDKKQEEVERILKQVEKECGRTREEKMRNIIRLDLDLLQWDTVRLREQDWERDYIRLLLQEMQWAF